MPTLESDVVGQVARLPLRPSEANALLPLFEGISNSLHAIQDRFGDDHMAANGRIDIEVLRVGAFAPGGLVTGFRVSDNGVGLDEANYRSFLRPFSTLKIARGSKGIGRLGWLKVFQTIHVVTRYKADGHLAHREFDFVLREADQVSIRAEGTGTEGEPGTTVTLTGFLDAYGAKCPVKTETIVQSIIAHFLPVFAGQKAPTMMLTDADKQVELSVEFEQKVSRAQEETIEIELDGVTHAFTIRHMQCAKAIRPRGGQNNWLCFCANERGVREYPIDEQIGLQVLDGSEIYIGSLTGDFLDGHVNPQRTDFIYEPEDGREIRRRVASRVKDFLGQYVEAALAQKKAITQTVIQKNPQHIYLHAELDAFVQSLKPNSSTEEAIYVEMAQHRYRRQRRFNGVKAEITKAPDYTEAIATKVEEYTSYVADDQRGALAEYVARRKSVLDLLDKLIGFDRKEDGRHHLEEAVHSLICPMRVDSHQLEIGDHNLWMLDDRLAFFSFFASDRPVSQVTNSDSGREPDLAFFYDSCVAWRESERSCDTVILVEFKRPGLEAYTDKNDPYMQLMDYITLFRAGKTVRDRTGKVISGIGPSTAFQCYIVADLTEGLRKRLRGRFEPTPDGKGLFGYTKGPDAYVEVIPYEKLLADAQARNAIFFDKLGLTG